MQIMDIYHHLCILLTFWDKLPAKGLHSDGRTTKGRATYIRTTNYRTKVRWSVSCLDLSTRIFDIVIRICDVIPKLLESQFIYFCA